ncbi:SDR family oxidoreductase [Halopseudomonas pachastrellae]|nr:SDR family oxidoreductase [Halopseudomonas pachastrellae]
MGPALQRTLQACGAEVVADNRDFLDPKAPQKLIAEAGSVDVLLLNLGVPAPSTPADQVEDEEWGLLFRHMVDPLPRFARAVLPAMTARGHGKIVLMGSASALRGMKRASSYSAARGAQLAWVQAVGAEVAGKGVQVNAIAQNFVDNPTYFPPEIQANPAFQARLQREVPLGRLVSAEEDSHFAAYLCSDAANCFVGQVFRSAAGGAIKEDTMQNTIPTIIRKRFCGPPNSGNGGYVCGLLANALGEPAQVTLHAPPPLDTDLMIVRDADGARLLQGETLLGSARPYQFALTLPPAVSLADAEAARPRFSGYEQHGLPGCFVCGTDRCEHDGLLLHTGPVTGRDSTVACPWTPDSTLDAGDGTVAREFVWAALDCPGYFAVKDQPA